MLQKLRRLPKSKMGLNERRISGRTGDEAVGEVVPASAEFKSSDTVNILDAMTLQSFLLRAHKESIE